MFVFAVFIFVFLLLFSVGWRWAGAFCHHKYSGAFSGNYLSSSLINLLFPPLISFHQCLVKEFKPWMVQALYQRLLQLVLWEELCQGHLALGNHQSCKEPVSMPCTWLSSPSCVLVIDQNSKQQLKKNLDFKVSKIKELGKPSVSQCSGRWNLSFTHLASPYLILLITYHNGTSVSIEGGGGAV